MASLLLVPARRAGGAARAAATEAAVAGRQDVCGSNILCRRVVDRSSSAYASGVDGTFSRLLRPAAVTYTSSTRFDGNLSVRVASLDREKPVSVDPSYHTRRLRGRTNDALDSPGGCAVRVPSASPFTQFLSATADTSSTATLLSVPAVVTPATSLSDAFVSFFSGSYATTPTAAPSSAAAPWWCVAASSSARVSFPPCKSFPFPFLSRSPYVLLLRGFTTRNASPATEDHASRVGGTSSDRGAGHTSDTGERSGTTTDNNSGTTTDNSKGTSDSTKSGKIPKNNSWLEVERVRPRAPNPWDGTYQWPAAAPDPLEIKRESFHAFMHGKQELFSRELKVFVYGWAVAAFLLGLTTLTIYVMAPDDFEWVEEERARMERAKRKKATAESFSFDLPPSSEADQLPADPPKPSA